MTHPSVIVLVPCWGVAILLYFHVHYLVLTRYGWLG